MNKLGKYLTQANQTPQTQPIPGKESKMVKMASGGYAFEAEKWDRLRNFLILGSEGGSYYAGERELTLENAKVVQACLREDYTRTIAELVDVSVKGLAPKQETTMLSLALAFCETNLSVDQRTARRNALLEICRTGSHLFLFLSYATKLRGGGRSLNGSVRAWLANKTPDQLGFQMTKFRNRYGWTWKDVFRRFRPKAGKNPERQALHNWLMAGTVSDELPQSVKQYIAVNTETNPTQLASIVEETRAPWEWVPTEASADKQVLSALVKGMPVGALIRQLPKITAREVLAENQDHIISALTNQEKVERARIHPANVGMAMFMYQKGDNRNLTWKPSSKVIDALDTTFRLALESCDPIEGKTLIAIDSSGSMTFGGGGVLTASENAAIMAHGLFNQCQDADVIVFDTAVKAFPLSSRMRSVDVVNQLNRVGLGGGTDCGLPFIGADKAGYQNIIVFTDSESWAGYGHAQERIQALQAKNNNLRVVWAKLVANRYSLTDPEVPNILNVVGIDPSMPKIISSFLTDSLT